MNGARTIFRRKGYLLTALAAAVLLAASSGTAWAQRVSIGFVDTSGQVSEKAFLDANSLTEPLTVTVRVSGLLSGSRRVGDIARSIGELTITPNKNIWIGRVTTSGYVGADGAPDTQVDVTADAAAIALAEIPLDMPFRLHNERFEHSDEVVLVVAQSEDGTGDSNWVSESVELHLEVNPNPVLATQGTPTPASVSPDVFTVMVEDSQAQPVAKFLQPNFTLSEDSTREVMLDIVSGREGVPIPRDDAAGGAAAFSGLISVRVSNQRLVSLTGCPTGAAGDPNKGKLFHIDFVEGTEWAEQNFSNTGVLQTTTGRAISDLADNPDTPSANVTADFEIEGCGDAAGIRDPYITLTIMETNLVGTTTAHRTNGNFAIGAPLMISVDSDEAVPTLSFSPTDVEIDEGGSTSTVLLAEGPNADDVGMVKLSVEGDAMVSLMQDGEMLEEMGGYVYVDLDGNTSARLEAMSHSDPDLMDGDMAFKAWKLMEGGTDGANIGEGYWFKVDVRGSTAVPALPLVGQLLLALFLMAGGARLYRRRQG